MSISVILPSYSEAENLEKLLPYLVSKLEKISTDFEVLVVDTMFGVDNSERIANDNDCTYLNRESGNNYGDAIRTGILKAKFDKILVMDADGSHDSKYIKFFYENMTNKNYDLIIGSRYVDGGGTDNTPLLKAMSFILNWTYKFVFKIKLHDISNSFRLYDASLLKKLELECDNFDIVEEILIKLFIMKKDLKVLEYPIFFNVRRFGHSKRNLFKFIFSYITTIKKLYNIQKRAKKGN